jgi:hypothetical protein
MQVIVRKTKRRQFHLFSESQRQSGRVFLNAGSESEDILRPTRALPHYASFLVRAIGRGEAFLHEPGESKFEPWTLIR